MLAKLSVPQQFYNWVCSKDPNEKYDYYSCTECACGQFAQEYLGLKAGTKEFGDAWDDHFWFSLGGGTSLNTIAAGGGGGFLNSFYRHHFPANWTYGKLRERLEERFPEYVS
jgi:hypothetical protein